MSKKKDKNLAHATRIWEEEQLAAASASAQLDKALEIIEENRNEITDEEYADLMVKFEERRADVVEFLMTARDKYAKKLEDIKLEAVVFDEKTSLVNLEDLDA